MVSKAIARFIRISPRKMRQVVDLIRAKTVYEALSILANLNKRAAELAGDVLKSAASNAKKAPEASDKNLYISKVTVDGGPMLKRYRAMSMGRAGMIRHRTSHITVELELAPSASVNSKVKSKKEKPQVKSQNLNRKKF